MKDSLKILKTSLCLANLCMKGGLGNNTSLFCIVGEGKIWLMISRMSSSNKQMYF